MTMYAQTLPAGVTYSAQATSSRCTGVTKAGTPCRATTLLTVVVAGTAHVACDPHAAQVAQREVDLLAAAPALDLAGPRETVKLPVTGLQDGDRVRVATWPLEELWITAATVTTDPATREVTLTPTAEEQADGADREYYLDTDHVDVLVERLLPQDLDPRDTAAVDAWLPPAQLLCGPVGGVNHRGQLWDMNVRWTCARTAQLYQYTQRRETLLEDSRRIGRLRSERRQANLSRYVLQAVVRLHAESLWELPECGHAEADRAELTLEDALPPCTC